MCLVVLGVSAVPEVSKTCANTRSVFDSITVQDLNGRTNSLKGNVYNELQSGNLLQLQVIGVGTGQV